MSERNVELLRRLVEAFNSRDLDAMLVLVDPRCEWHSVFAEVFGGVYHGHDGVRMWHRDLEDAWGDKVRVESEAYFDLGEHTLSFQTLHGRGRHSGAKVVMPAEAHVFRWRDGLIIYFKAYAQREDALRDLGVSEDKLERIEP
jgi:ketosteroid isomerase-like protein